MKEIPLTQDKVTLVDDSDFEELNRFKWYVAKMKNTFRAVRACMCPSDGKQHMVYMHRQLVNTHCNMDIDHINHDTLDNRRSNLRVCTRTQNSQNQQSDPEKGFSSRFKGVYWHKRDKKWETAIRRDGKAIYLGRFNDETNAARAYDAKAIELFGEYACLNFDRKKVG